MGWPANGEKESRAGSGNYIKPGDGTCLNIRALRQVKKFNTRAFYKFYKNRQPLLLLFPLFVFFYFNNREPEAKAGVASYL